MSMTSQSSKATANASTGQAVKVIACGVLVIGLIIALAFPPKEEEVANGDAALPTSESGLGLKVVDPTSLTKRTEVLSTLTRRSLEDIAATNPFAVFREEVPQEPVVETPPVPQAPPATLMAVYGKSKQEAALVGTQVVRTGDTLQDGRAVERIERRAVIAK